MKGLYLKEPNGIRNSYGIELINTPDSYLNMKILYNVTLRKHSILNPCMSSDSKDYIYIEFITDPDRYQEEILDLALLISHDLGLDLKMYNIDE